MHKRAVMLLALAAILLTGCNDQDRSTDAGAPAGQSPSPAPVPGPPPVTTSDSATLEWLAPTTATDGSPLDQLLGYRIYYGTDVTRMDQTIEVRNPGVLSYVVENLPPGTYYFAVTALSAAGESERSNAGRKIIG